MNYLKTKNTMFPQNSKHFYQIKHFREIKRIPFNFEWRVFSVRHLVCVYNTFRTYFYGYRAPAFKHHHSVALRGYSHPPYPHQELPNSHPIALFCLFSTSFSLSHHPYSHLGSTTSLQQHPIPQTTFLTGSPDLRPQILGPASHSSTCLLIQSNIRSPKIGFRLFLE